MVKAKFPFARLAFICVFLIASALLIWHITQLVRRHSRGDIFSQIRTFTNKTVKFPTIYLWLYYPIRVDFPMNYTIVHEFQQQRIYELSDWTKFEAIGQTMVQLPFCAVEITGAQGYLGVIDTVDEKTNIKGLLNPLTTTTKPLPLGGRSTLSIEMKHVSVLPPPYSACANEYPSEFNLTATRKNSHYSQGDCYLYCRASWLMATNCSCSLREWTGLDTPASSTLPSCRIYDANETANDLHEQNLTDICRFEPKQWFVLTQVIDVLQSMEASRQCNICADQCSYTEYVSNLDTLPSSEVADCPHFQENPLVNVHKSTVIVHLKNRITTIHEQFDYLTEEFYSDMLGIFGAYLGLLLCIFAKFFQSQFVNAFNWLRKCIQGTSFAEYDISETNTHAYSSRSNLMQQSSADAIV